MAEGPLAICYRVVPGDREIRLPSIIFGSMINENVTDIGGTKIVLDFVHQGTNVL